MRRRLVLVLGVFVLGLPVVRLASSPSPSKPTDPGSLVKTTAQSTVGVLLDEIPPAMRERVVAALIGRPAGFWRERAAQQLRLTSYRLVFRQFFYSQRRNQLPLPPEAVWNIALVGAPSRRTIGGHDVVAVDYLFSSILLSDVESPGVSEPHLRKVGGVWHEPFVLPVDPEMLLQRTGFACMDEEDFPFNSVDSEEVDSFYDHTCTVERGLSNVGQCHFTQQPGMSCVAAIDARVGRVETQIRYERLPWDASVADRVRYGKVTGDAPDLEIYVPDFLPSRVTYRYIHGGGCEVVEGSVNGTGWRRLLQFATSDENVGSKTLTIGGVDYTITGHSGELDSHNLFEYSACHNHYHFKYYGDFTWQGDSVVNSKKGFCLKSTARTSNRELSPLHNPFGSCDFQGVEVGWADQYKAGLPSQWLDITGFPAGNGTRAFRSNPNGFLCEGVFVDENGRPLEPGEPVVWAPTGLVADNGQPVEAPLCSLSPGWHANNRQETVDTIPPPGDGLITTPCARGQIGPLRNCGFTKPETHGVCSAGEIVTLTLSIEAQAAPQVARVCEFSHALGSPIPCRYEDSYVPLAPGVSDQPYTLGGAIVSGDAPATISFRCPAPRTGGAFEPGGAYSIYTAPVLPDDPHSPVRWR